MADDRPRLDIVEVSYSADPAFHFQHLRDRPGAALLDSGRPHNVRGRFDILTSDPVSTLIAERGTLRTTPPSRLTTGDLFDVQQHLLAKAEVNDLPTLPSSLTPLADSLPFIGGWLGFWGYNAMSPTRMRDDDEDRRPGPALPDARLGLYDWALIQDHHRGRAFLVATPARQQQVLAWLAQPPSNGEANDDFRLLGDFRPDLDREAYGQRFRRVIDYLRAGDCYQINLAQRFTAPITGDPWHAYARLRRATPTPYGGFLAHDDQAILSLSPERFVSVLEGHVDTRPIKGTRARGETPDADERQIRSLRASPKDRAENVMIVDLLRNDLGRVCRPGSVRVSQLCALESYANVHHLVSVIEGELAPERSALDLLRAAFPGGSITGAPKHRAMQIIDELEPCPRSVYCGSLGYLDRRGRLDTSIAIRTAIVDAGTLHIWGGGGLVADSEEEAEYQETIDKIAHLMRALANP